MIVLDLSKQYQGGFTARRKRTPYRVVHHAAALYRSPDHALGAVWDWHVNQKGWPGIGYHEVLVEHEDGTIGAITLSDPMSQRAHVWGRNHEAFGISCLTDFNDRSRFPDRLPTEPWIAALAERLRFWGEQPGFGRSEIVGHRDIALPGYGTACPGHRWDDWKADLLQRVAGATPTTIKRFLVRWNDTNVRTAPRDDAPIAWDGRCVLSAGYQFDGVIERGASYTSTRGATKGVTSNLWVHMASGDGFVWKPLLREIPS